MSVLKRTCYYQKVDGTIRPFEWARIIDSTFGVMVEPFWPFENNSTVTGHQGTKLNDDFSTNNDFQRVDEFVEIDEAGFVQALNNGLTTSWMNGGRHFPRTGR